MRLRRGYLSFGLPVALALVAGALFLWGRSSFTSVQATDTGPQMSLNATGPVVCTGGTAGKPTKCSASAVGGKAAQLNLTVSANTIPDGGYAGFGSAVYFGGLTYNTAACTNEVVWPDEGPGVCFQSIVGASTAVQK